MKFYVLSSIWKMLCWSIDWEWEIFSLRWGEFHISLENHALFLFFLWSSTAGDGSTLWVDALGLPSEQWRNFRWNLWFWNTFGSRLGRHWNCNCHSCSTQSSNGSFWRVHDSTSRNRLHHKPNLNQTDTNPHATFIYVFILLTTEKGTIKINLI